MSYDPIALQKSVSALIAEHGIGPAAAQMQLSKEALLRAAAGIPIRRATGLSLALRLGLVTSTGAP